MKRFLFLVIAFSLLVFGGTLTIVLMIKAKVANGPYYSIDSKISYLFVGHSLSECAFNDSLIPSSINLSASANAPPFIYLKTKKLVEDNPNIQVVFISFSNNSIAEYGDKWVWEDNYLDGHYTKYASLFNLSEYELFLSRKLRTILRLESLCLRKNLQFLMGENPSYIKFSSWGGYKYNTRICTDSLIKAQAVNDSMYRSKAVSSISIGYLKSTINLLKEKNIKPILVRTPIHSASHFLLNEVTFQSVHKDQLYNAEFWDFKDFPVSDSERADLTHLNFKGARKFSLFFEQLLQKGLLDSTNKQEMIDRKMEELGIQ